jgi:hypothetical protein
VKSGRSRPCASAPAVNASRNAANQFLSRVIAVLYVS